MNEMTMLRDHYDAQPGPSPDTVGRARARLTGQTRVTAFSRPGEPEAPGGISGSRRRLRVLVPAASLALVGALAATAYAVVNAGKPPSDRPSAKTQLAAAVDHTNGRSFRYHTVGTDKYLPGEVVDDGAYDPTRRLGWLTTSRTKVLYVGDTVYTKWTGRSPLPPGKWLSERGAPQAMLHRSDLIVQVGGLSDQDPQFVLQQLKKAPRTRQTGTASGTGWTGHRYSFTLPPQHAATIDSGTPQYITLAMSISGSVQVDSDGHVRVLEYTTYQAGTKSDHEVTTFSDYGTPVSVTAPPADQVITLDQFARQRRPGSKPSSK